MSGNDQPDFAAIRNGEELGLVFSEDKKTLLACVNEEIRELVIPGHVTAVGSHAFFDKCKKLTRITLHSGITDIGCGAFAYCEI